jgi:catechol 2,3-dioxygenase-like lactoylglutathione lyase family enzyme
MDQEDPMSRLQLALNVDDMDRAVTFYSRLFGAEPAKRRPGYEVESTERVDAEQRRLAEAGLASVDSRGSTCCYAEQDKFWVEGAPHGELWEIYTVLADSEVFGADDTPEACCADAGTEQDEQTRATACC